MRGRTGSTLNDLGWLAPATTAPARPRWARLWETLDDAARGKCLYLQIPREVRDAMRQEVAARRSLSPAHAPRAVATPVPPRRRDPLGDPRLFPAMSREVAAKKLAAEKQARRMTTRWYEDPVAMGCLLLLCPPVALAALWTSRRYATDARWALTVVTGLALTLAAFVAILAFRR